jgi:hypothetical protein
MSVPIMNMRTAGPPSPLNWPINGDHHETAVYYDTLLTHVGEWLREVTTPEERIDELAVAAPDEAWALRFVRNLVGSGYWSYTNTATDYVRTEPFGTSYPVRYHFLKHPAYPWRMEVMHIDQEHMMVPYSSSPVHDALWGSFEEGEDLFSLPVVHASFKCSSDDEYERCVQNIAAAAQHAQTCIAQGYGYYSYWLPIALTDLLYIKPRVNTRDVPAVSIPMQVSGGGPSA